MKLNKQEKASKAMAEELLHIAEIKNIKFPNNFVKNISNLGIWKHCNDWRGIIRSIYEKDLLMKYYEFVFGIISKEDLKNVYNEWEAFDKKFRSGGEYSHILSFSLTKGKDFKYDHISLRPARLLPQY